MGTFTYFLVNEDHKAVLELGSSTGRLSSYWHFYDLPGKVVSLRDFPEPLRSAGEKADEVFARLMYWLRRHEPARVVHEKQEGEVDKFEHDDGFSWRVRPGWSAETLLWTVPGDWTLAPLEPELVRLAREAQDD